MDRLAKSVHIAEQQARSALLHAVHRFLQRNGIRDDSMSTLKEEVTRNRLAKRSSHLNRLWREYEEMGTLLAAWFSFPKFLNSDGIPVSLSLGKGPRSLGALIKAARISVSTKTAVGLLRRSPSVQFERDGTITVLRKVFVLPEFAILRAAIGICRYLETLGRNSLAHRTGAMKLLERHCCVSGVNLDKIGPILRNIRERGSAFVDSVDSELETGRRGPSKDGDNAEVGLLVFAWTKRKGKTTSGK